MTPPVFPVGGLKGPTGWAEPSFNGKGSVRSDQVRALVAGAAQLSESTVVHALVGAGNEVRGPARLDADEQSVFDLELAHVVGDARESDHCLWNGGESSRAQRSPL